MNSHYVTIMIYKNLTNVLFYTAIAQHVYMRCGYFPHQFYTATWQSKAIVSIQKVTPEK